MNKIPDFSSGLPLSGFQPQNLPLSFKDGETALIQSVQSPGTYLVIFKDGTRVLVKGQENLEIGNPVRVFRAPNVPSNMQLDQNLADTLLMESEAALALTAFIPLGFGGKGAKAKLEVYTSKEKVNINNKKVIYFIIALTTERLGDLQWSFQLWGRNVEAQLFAARQVDEKDIHELTQEVEVSFKRAGFYLMSSVVRLEEPFKIPQGFRMDWKA